MTENNDEGGQVQSVGVHSLEAGGMNCGNSHNLHQTYLGSKRVYSRLMTKVSTVAGKYPNRGSAGLSVYCSLSEQDTGVGNFPSL